MKLDAALRAFDIDVSGLTGRAIVSEHEARLRRECALKPET